MDSILKTIKLKKEIVIVDNGSKDGSVEFVEKVYPEIILIKNPKNRGVAPARNQGMATAKGEYLLILDVDTIVHNGAIDNLINTMESDRKVGLCGPKLVDKDGKIQYSCREFPNILSKAYRQLPKKWQNYFLKKEELRDWPHDTLREVDYVIGACQLIRKEALNDVGFLDSRMFYGVEEVDFCLRLWKKGWKVIYNPTSVVTHFEQRLGRKQIISRLQIEHIKSLIIYFWKHKYILKAPEFRALRSMLNSRISNEL